MTKIALLQLTSTDDPAANLATVLDMLSTAAADGAEWVLTPEVTNCVSASRTHQKDVLRLETDDQTLPAIQDAAKTYGIWILVGSLGLKTEDADGRFANRSFLIAPDGSIRGRYDKIHMFDVQVTPEETYRESAGYRPGDKAVLAETPFGRVGMTICYDLRFPTLYQQLAAAGAEILTIPAAFSPVTGAAHWQPLLRARAIETGCFVIAPAQCGTHPTSRGKQRRTYGHSMVISPWGEILLDAGTEPGIHISDISAKSVADTRAKIPSLANRRDFSGPT